MRRVLAAIGRFLDGATLATSLAAFALAIAGALAGPTLYAWTIVGLSEFHGEVVYRSPAEASLQVALARLAAAAVPVLGWLLATGRGARRGRDAAMAAFARFTPIVLGGALAAAIARAAVFRWLVESTRTQGLNPMIAIADVGIVEWAIGGEAIAACALLVLVARETR